MFAPYKRGAESDALEYLPVTGAEAVAVGEALVLTSGKLTKCGAMSPPTRGRELKYALLVDVGAGLSVAPHAGA